MSNTGAAQFSGIATGGVSAVAPVLSKAQCTFQKAAIQKTAK
jgi:hypothetical protein